MGDSSFIDQFKAYDSQIERMIEIIRRILVTCYFKCPNSQRFKLISNVEFFPYFNDLSKKEKEIFLASQTMKELISKLHRLFIYEHSTLKSLGEIIDMTSNLLKEAFQSNENSRIITLAIDKLMVEDVSYYKEYHRKFIAHLVKKSVNRCKAIIREYENSYKTNPTRDTYIIINIVQTTVKCVLQELKKRHKPDEISNYVQFINDVLEIWKTKINKRRPNNVYSAFLNILEFERIEAGAISNLKNVFIVMYKYHNTYKNRKVMLIRMLELAFADNLLNTKRLETIKNLCTPLMDIKTFNKYMPKR